MQDLKLVQDIQFKEEGALVALAEKYQKGFVSWAGAIYHFKEEEIHDFYVDALMDFHKNVLAGKFSFREEESVKNYLFTIFKNKLVNEVIKRKNRHSLQNKVDGAAERWSLYKDVEEDLIDREKVRIIADCMNELGENCQKILHLFYFERMSLKEIAEKLGYKNDKTAKAKRHQCFQKLKKIVKDRYSNDEL